MQYDFGNGYLFSPFIDISDKSDINSSAHIVASVDFVVEVRTGFWVWSAFVLA